MRARTHLPDGVGAHGAHVVAEAAELGQYLHGGLRSIAALQEVADERLRGSVNVRRVKGCDPRGHKGLKIVHSRGACAQTAAAWLPRPEHFKVLGRALVMWVQARPFVLSLLLSPLRASAQILYKMSAARASVFTAGSSSTPVAAAQLPAAFNYLQR